MEHVDVAHEHVVVQAVQEDLIRDTGPDSSNLEQLRAGRVVVRRIRELVRNVAVRMDLAPVLTQQAT